MAAHPFGPIEKFLITSCKPLKNDPRDAKLTFGDKQCFECPSVEDNLFWGFCQPRLVLEPTANVNSSDFTVHTALKLFEEDISEGMYSLSRGLGYRITFTMPADRELKLDFTKLWPTMEIQVLDFFGENVLANFKYEPLVGGDPADPEKETKGTIHPDDFSQAFELFQRAERIYGTMNTLTIEMTSLGVKAFKDSEVVVNVPLNTGLLLDDRRLTEFDIIYTRSLTESREALDWLLARLEGFAYHFNKHGLKLTKDHLLRVEPAFLGLLEQLSTVWISMSPRLKKDEEENPIPKLKTDWDFWMDGGASKPNYLNWSFVMELKQTFESRGRKYGYQEKPIHPVNISCWSHYLLRMLENVLKTPDLAILDQDTRSRKYFTKDFTILEVWNKHSSEHLFRPWSPVQLLFFESKQNKSTPKDAFLSFVRPGESDSRLLKIEFVVPNLNLIIGRAENVSRNVDRPDQWRIVDLEMAQAVHDGKSTGCPFADIKIGFPEGEKAEYVQSCACETGLFISNSKVMEFYTYDALFSRKADEECLRIPIQLVAPESQLKIVEICIKESKNKGEFFMMLMVMKESKPAGPVEEELSDDDQSTGASSKHFSFSFVRMKLSADKSNLTVTAKQDHRFEEDLYYPNMLWLETKSGRMLGCIETPAKVGDRETLQLFALVYVNRKFMPLRFAKKLHLGMMSFNATGKLHMRLQNGKPRQGWKEWKQDEELYGDFHGPSQILLLVEPPFCNNDGVEIMCIKRLQLTH